jgi:hypothetical protein
MVGYLHFLLTHQKVKQSLAHLTLEVIQKMQVVVL